ncbi:MAG: M17 family peptidase N-terminal domain-containing protein, partial [Phycisphaerales bacterium JB061]
MFDSISVGGRSAPSAVVVGRFKDKPAHASSKAYDPDGSVAEACKRPESSGEYLNLTHAFPKSSGRGKTKTPPRVIVAGLGTQSKLTAGCFRDLGAALAKAASSIKATSLSFDLSGPIKDAKLDEGACASALAEGFGLMGWSYDRLRGSATSKNKFGKIALTSPSKSFESGLTRGLGLAESTNIARDLSQTPPNIATPAWMASEAQKMARKAGLKCTVYKGAQLESMGLVGCKTVGQASENAPCMIRLEYTPKNAGKKSKPVVLVGKTMTYDSGGLSIKVGGGMRGMKRDKDGGCAVFGAMHAIA